MSGPPSDAVISAMENGVAEVTRRVEIYETDGVTPWYPNADSDAETDRLTGGNITIDYNSDERRKADITLLNDDFAFRLNPNGGFYYDKVIKLFRGVKYSNFFTKYKVAIIESEYTGNNLVASMRNINAAGYLVDYLPNASTQGDVEGYDIVMVLMNTSAFTKSTYLNSLFAAGKSIVTVGSNEPSIPHIATYGGLGETISIVPATNENPLKGKVPTGDISSGGSKTVLSLTSWGQRVGNFPSGAIILSYGTNRAGAHWFDFHSPGIIGNQAITVEILKIMFDYMVNKGEENVWEAQLGEFLIDGANDKLFPNQISLTMRDYTKKLLKDKLTFTSTFVAGTPVKTFVRAIAANGGIVKFREAIGDEVFPTDISYERTTERWKIIKEVCTAFDYEVYFDNEGYLAVRKFNDPTLAPIYHTFQTGIEGNLVSLDRSLNDSRIYNIINIYGDPISNDRLPYFGQAINDDPSSPTSTVKLGNRPWEFAANYFSSDEECLELARSRLKIMGLESYDINFSSIFYPWMEVGEVVQILDPHRIGTDPTRFLMDTVSFPIDLGPMSGTGKRVTLVGSSG